MIGGDHISSVSGYRDGFNQRFFCREPGDCVRVFPAAAARRVGIWTRGGERAMVARRAVSRVPKIARRRERASGKSMNSLNEPRPRQDSVLKSMEFARILYDRRS